MSRVHVSIGYERLDDNAREQIWENLFRKLKEDHKNGEPEIRYEYEAKQYVKKSDEVRRLEWNGWEIRNGTLFPDRSLQLSKLFQTIYAYISVLGTTSVPNGRRSRRLRLKAGSRKARCRRRRRGGQRPRDQGKTPWSGSEHVGHFQRIHGLDA